MAYKKAFKQPKMSKWNGHWPPSYARQERPPGQSSRDACRLYASGRTARSSLGQELKTSDLRRPPSGGYGTILEMEVHSEWKHTGEWEHIGNINILDVEYKPHESQVWDPGTQSAGGKWRAKTIFGACCTNIILNTNVILIDRFKHHFYILLVNMLSPYYIWHYSFVY